MKFSRKLGLGAAMSLAMGLLSVAPLPAASVQEQVESGLAGTWSGSFAQTEYTFEFVRNESTWSGRYMSARNDKWQAMQSLKVVGNAATFSLNSHPIVTFELKLGSNNNSLDGNIDFVGKKLPFSSVRKI